MKCPVCKTALLDLQELEPELHTLNCSSCGGNWIQSFRYWRWRSQHAPSLPERPPAESETIPIHEPSAAKQCPECGHILIKHRVGHGLDFALDRCGNCGGIWLDGDEWQALKSRNLHEDAHRIFNAVWQREVSEAEKAEARDRRLTAILGEVDLAEARRIREWIHAHPHKNTLLALLIQDQP